jgi:DNA-binding transcriptional MerR regulator
MGTVVSADRHLRIGELSRRTGVSSELLRAWERRYGLFAPARTAGGYRLYGDQDVRRAERMRFHVGAGLSAAEAADVTVSEFDGRQAKGVEEAELPQAFGDELERALDRLDDASAHAALDWLFARFATETVLRDVVLPYMRGLGERWQRGEEVIAAEHFASALLRGRLLGLARGWNAGGGPLALLACVPGDQHDIGLICFGLALRGRGWRIGYLGADTPLETIGQTTELLYPAIVVVGASLVEQTLDAADGLAALARQVPLAMGGGAVNAELAASIGVLFLADDPLGAAATVVAGVDADSRSG